MAIELINTLILVSIALFLSLLVITRNPRAKTNRYFSAFVLCGIIWILSNFFENQGLNMNVSTFFLHTDFAAAAFVSYFWLLFCINFPQPSHEFGVSRTLFAFIPTLFFSVVSFSNLIIKDVSIQGNTIHAQPGIFFVPYALYIFTYMVIASLSVLLIKYRQSKNVAKQQILYVFIGLFLTSIIAATINLIVPQIVPDMSFSTARFGIYSSIFLFGFTAYAILRLRLMDIRAFVMRSVAYTIMLTIIGLIFVFFVNLAKSKYTDFINTDVLFIIAGLAASLGFQPLRTIIESYSDKIFAKRRYDFKELLNKIGKALSESVALGELARKTIDIFIDDMKVEKAAFIATRGSSNDEIWQRGYEFIKKYQWHKLLQLTTSDKPIITDELVDDSEAKLLLSSLSIQALFALRDEGENLGVIALGEKKSGNIYTIQDLKLIEIIAPEIAIALKHAKLFEQKETRIRELDALSRLSLNLGSTLDLESILNMIIDEAIEATGGENGSIMLIEDDRRTLSIKASRGIDIHVARRTKIRMGEGIAGWACQENESIVIINGKHDNKYIQQCLKNERISSSLTVPLRVNEKVIGVLCINRQKKKEVFTEESLRLMNSFAAHAAEAIENARLFDNLEKTFLGTISALAKAVDARDRYTFGHSEEVTRYAVEIAKRMNLTKEEIDNIKIASKLHDIGKIGISDTILNKPARLTADERKVIEQHPKIAVDILKTVDLLKDVIPLILYHHEHYDGKGYPTGLACEAIPVGARIITVADSFNAMTSNRPYANPKSIEEAITELKGCAGTQFDPKVIVAFLRVLADEHDHIEGIARKLEADLVTV